MLSPSASFSNNQFDPVNATDLPKVVRSNKNYFQSDSQVLQVLVNSSNVSVCVFFHVIDNSLQKTKSNGFY